ncbi:MAG: hypothetical protein HYX92_06665 [Chloroflexi bacterium]|nr:hypothetical protein [Chloroflexota bacterium]
MYGLVTPLGKSTVSGHIAAPRLQDLNGKTVGEIWNGSFRGNVTFPIIRELLKKRYPDIKVIPYTEFPTPGTHGETESIQKAADTAALMAKQRGCDAVITGNGF